MATARRRIRRGGGRYGWSLAEVLKSPGMIDDLQQVKIVPESSSAIPSARTRLR